MELDKDSDEVLWLSIHSGSRNLGKQVCEIYQAKAIDARNLRLADISIKKDYEIRQLKEEGNTSAIQSLIESYRDKMMREPNDDLCYIEGQDLEDYLHDMRLCNEWSYRNHLAMYDSIMQEYDYDYTDDPFFDHITCIHNYVDVDNKIIRKGAISAQEGERCIIPLNMRDGILIGVGKGNSDYNSSAPHGAGRIMSRGEAKKNISLDDFKDSMKGIYTTCVNESTLDESVFAYKDAAAIEAAIEPTVEVTDHLVPIWNFKDSK